MLMRLSGRFEISTSPSSSVRQMPSSVASISADWSEATVRWASSLARSLRPASAEPTASANIVPVRIAICAPSTVTWLVWFAMIHSPTAPAPAIAPPSTPTSKPISATHGANVTMPSLLDHSKAIISPQVAARPATATKVTK